VINHLFFYPIVFLSQLANKQENGVDFKAYKDYKRSKSDMDLLLL